MSYTDQCPLFEECKEYIYEVWFRVVCSSKRWVYCKFAKEKAKEYSMKPKEWKNLVFEQKMPIDWLKGKQPPEEAKEAEKPKRKSWL